jgi:hypothetical protein
LSDTDESESDFHDEEGDMLCDSGDDYDGDENVHLANTDFLWEDVDN